MKIWIGCDHGGYNLKIKLIELLKEIGAEYKDVGCNSTGIVRYPYYAALVAGAVARGEADRGVLICTTGIGMCIMANKYKGVRGALCSSVEIARLTREHNDSNVLCFSGGLDAQLAKEILKTWLTADFIGGRHNISLDLIGQAENQMMNGNHWAEKEENYR